MKVVVMDEKRRLRGKGAEEGLLGGERDAKNTISSVLVMEPIKSHQVVHM